MSNVGGGYNNLDSGYDRNVYLQKINAASIKQLELFKRAQEARQNQALPAKERLIQQYMQMANQGANYGPGGGGNMFGSPKSKPLGKAVSQLEL